MEAVDLLECVLRADGRGLADADGGDLGLGALGG